MKKVPLAEVATINPPVERVPAESEVSFVGMAELDAVGAVARPLETRRFSEVSKGYTVFHDGDLLAAKITPCWENGKVGQANLSHPIGVGSTEFHVLRPGPKLDDRYLLQFLRQPFVRRAGELRMTGSAGQKRVPPAFLQGLDIPLPSLAEQRRIAAILDHADAVRVHRRQVLASLDSLAESVFHQMFAERRDHVPFGDTCERITVGVVVRPASHYVESGVPALRTLNVKPGRIVQSDLVYFSAASNDGPLAKSRLKAGDLVIARTGKAGTAAIVPPELDGANAIDLIIATPNTDVALPIYLEALLNSATGKRVVSGESRGQIQQHFNVGSLKNALVPLPPLSLQHEFAGWVDQINRQRAAVLRAASADEALFLSIQSRAFEGAL